ncbi:MAG: hypothetical protein IPG32_12770 [Saprospirales bacterium]|nr:hypothetical protein [Saprospirales bacterium]
MPLHLSRMRAVGDAEHGGLHEQFGKITPAHAVVVEGIFFGDVPQRRHVRSEGVGGRLEIPVLLHAQVGGIAVIDAGLFEAEGGIYPRVLRHDLRCDGLIEIPKLLEGFEFLGFPAVFLPDQHVGQGRCKFYAF